MFSHNHFVMMVFLSAFPLLSIYVIHELLAKATSTNHAVNYFINIHFTVRQTVKKIL